MNNTELIARLQTAYERGTFAELRDCVKSAIPALEAAQPSPQVPMTDKEIAGAWISIPDPVALGSKFNGSDAVRDFVRGIEAHHGIGVKP